MKKLVVLFNVFVISTTLASAQLLEVRQTIFGMDCAPCARGVELALKKIEGVQSVKMSLNKGLAEIALTPENTVTIQEVRSAIQRNGFTPKEATVLVKGTLVEQEKQIILRTEKESYALIQGVTSKDVFIRLQKSKDKSQVTVRGVIVESKDTGEKLRTIEVLEVNEQQMKGGE